MLLTAVHFHYAGFGSLIIAALAGRRLAQVRPGAWSMFHFVVTGAIAGLALIAAGITFSRLIEVAGAFLLTLSLWALSVLVLRFIAPAVPRRSAQALLTISAASLVLPMLLAAFYAAGRLTGTPSIAISEMVETHGVINALGFVLGGLLGWTVYRPSAGRVAPPGIPFSGLAGRGYVGPDFFHRRSAVPDLSCPPIGLVDDLSEYRRTGFDPDAIHPAIRRIYEQTARYDLLVRPDWKPGFGLGARLFKVFSSRVGQMNFNIAFPFPGGNLTSILRFETVAIPDQKPAAAAGPLAVVLTTFPTPAMPGDQGIYLVNRILPLRLSMNETIQVWAVGMPHPVAPGSPGWETATVVARHDVWIFGIKFLTLDYHFSPHEAALSSGPSDRVTGATTVPEAVPGP